MGYSMLSCVILLPIIFYQSKHGGITIMAPKAKDKTSSANVVDNAIATAPTTDNSKAVTIDDVSYDMTNLVDVVRYRTENMS
jgi:hypothetical protein